MRLLPPRLVAPPAPPPLPANPANTANPSYDQQWQFKEQGKFTSTHTPFRQVCAPYPCCNTCALVLIIGLHCSPSTLIGTPNPTPYLPAYLPAAGSQQPSSMPASQQFGPYSGLALLRPTQILPASKPRDQGTGAPLAKQVIGGGAATAIEIGQALRGRAIERAP